MTKKKILIINGHPDKESFNYGLSDAYKNGVEKSGAEVKEIRIRELNFNPNLQFGYRKRTELEPDLLEAQKKLKWAILNASLAIGAIVLLGYLIGKLLDE